MGDYIIRGLEADGNFRFFIAKSVDLVEGLRKIHNASPTSIAALGRLATASAILGDMLKNDSDKVSIQIKGEGTIRNIVAVSNSKCEVKAYISDPLADVPLREDGKLDVGGAIGRGSLVLSRDMGLRDPYVGHSELVSGEIAEDLANYFAKSEQQPSAVALGVLVDRDYSISGAGGYIIQVMPDASEDAIEKLEKNIAKSDSISKMISEGLEPEDIAEVLLEGFEYNVNEKKDISLKCDCSRDRMETILFSLGKEELENLLEEQDDVEIVCHFCNEKYKFDIGQVQGIISEIKG